MEDEAALMLEALADLAAARAGAAEADNHTAMAVEIYGALAAGRPGLEAAARDALAPLLGRALGDAAAARAQADRDPLAPGLEAEHYALLAELSALAALYAGDAAAHAALSREIGEVMQSASQAAPAWRLLRASYAAARRAPPPRRPPRAPLADDAEYYAAF